MNGVRQRIVYSTLILDKAPHGFELRIRYINVGLLYSGVNTIQVESLRYRKIFPVTTQYEPMLLESVTVLFREALKPTISISNE